MEKNDFKLFGVLFFLFSYKIFLSARTTKENYKVLPFAVLMMYIASKSYNCISLSAMPWVGADEKGCGTTDRQWISNVRSVQTCFSVLCYVV